MSLKPIECANCGAQYRLPETFKADHAKCKKCGATIDVAAQRDAAPPAPEAAAEAPAPKPAKPAKPAAATPRRSTTPPRRAEKAEPAAPAPRRRTTRSRAGGAAAGGSTARRSSRRRQEEEEPEETQPVTRSSRSRGGRSSGRSGSSRRGGGGEREEKKSNMPLIVGGGIGLLAIIVVVLVFALQGGDEPEKTETANSTQESQKSEAAKPEETTPAEQPAEPPVADAVAQPGDAEAAPAVEKKAAKPAPKPRKKKELTSKEDVFKPSEELEPLEWPEFVSAEEREEITGYLTDVRNGGLHGARAKVSLEKLGAKSLVGIVNQLRELNYLDDEDTMFAYELNRLLTIMAAGRVNADFHSVNSGDEVSLEDADWNGKTVKAWQRFVDKYGTPEALARLNKGKSEDK